MNREIKFRVWDKKLECFGHGCRNQLTDRNNNNLCISDTAIGFKKIDKNDFDTALNFNKCSFREIVNNERYILTQYTGLKDKNGKGIYEGDILEFTDKWEWYRREWAPKFIFANKEKKRDLQKQYDLLPMHRLSVEMSAEEGVNFSTYDLREYRWEVIGNIFENPELLT